MVLAVWLKGTWASCQRQTLRKHRAGWVKSTKCGRQVKEKGWRTMELTERRGRKQWEAHGQGTWSGVTVTDGKTWVCLDILSYPLETYSCFFFPSRDWLTPGRISLILLNPSLFGMTFIMHPFGSALFGLLKLEIHQ